MFDDLLLLHRPGPTRLFDASFIASEVTDVSAVFNFETCLRHIVVGSVENLAPFLPLITESDEVLRGAHAYRFLLEVVCGLHSPLVGETEVGGQFRRSLMQFSAADKATKEAGDKERSQSYAVSRVEKMLNSVLTDAKAVRDRHLIDLGGQSYGSLLRREFKNESGVHVMGAGQLVNEILPWMGKGTSRVLIHCRNPLKAQRELGALSQIKNAAVHSLHEADIAIDNEAIVIAAPVTALEICQWIDRLGQPSIIVDLRADSVTDPVQGFSRVVRLPELTARVQEHQGRIEQKKILALANIAQIVNDRTLSVEYRPFGWDDVCA